MIESLKDPDESAAYLDAVLEDCNYDELRLALRNVMEARLAILGSSQVDLNQEIVQKILSPQADLGVDVLLETIGELGFKLSVTPIGDAA